MQAALQRGPAASCSRRPLESAGVARTAVLALAGRPRALHAVAPSLQQIRAQTGPVTPAKESSRHFSHVARALATRETSQAKSGLPERPLSVCIAGGGIGGLVLAVALLKKGVKVRGGRKGSAAGIGAISTTAPALLRVELVLQRARGRRRRLPCCAKRLVANACAVAAALRTCAAPPPPVCWRCGATPHARTKPPTARHFCQPARRRLPLSARRTPAARRSKCMSAT
jgi:hypothetical protein